MKKQRIPFLEACAQITGRNRKSPVAGQVVLLLAVAREKDCNVNELWITTENW